MIECLLSIDLIVSILSMYVFCMHTIFATLKFYYIFQGQRKNFNKKKQNHKIGTVCYLGTIETYKNLIV